MRPLLFVCGLSFLFLLFRINHAAWDLSPIITVGVEQSASANFSDLIFVGDTDSGFGTALASCDVNGDGHADLILGEPQYSEIIGQAGVEKGRVIVSLGGVLAYNSTNLFNVANETDGSGFSIVGTSAYDQFGTTVTCGDVNGDGISDIVACAPTATAYIGYCYVIYGHTDTNQISRDVDEGLVDGIKGYPIVADYSDMPKNANNQNFGWAATVVDINGDGFGEVCIGGYGSLQVPGRVFCVIGGALSPAILPVDVRYALSGVITFEGVPGDNSGWSLSGGDVNGDGLNDLIIGATGRSVGPNSHEGAVFGVYGSTAAWPRTVLLNSMGLDEGFVIRGTGPQQRLGWAVAVGDVNGDGVEDIAVSSINDSPNGLFQSGSVYVIFGAPIVRVDSMVGFVNSVGSLDSSTGVQLVGGAIGYFFGRSLAFGDTNGDGIVDLIVGSSDVSRSNPDNPKKLIPRTGEIAVLFGACNFGGYQISSRDLGSGTGFLVQASNALDQLGFVVAAAKYTGTTVDNVMGGAFGGSYVTVVLYDELSEHVSCPQLSVPPADYFPVSSSSGESGNATMTLPGSRIETVTTQVHIEHKVPMLHKTSHAQPAKADNRQPMVIVLVPGQTREDQAGAASPTYYQISLPCGVSSFNLVLDEITKNIRPTCIYVSFGSLPDGAGGVYDAYQCSTQVGLVVNASTAKRSGPCDLCIWYAEVTSPELSMVYNITLNYDTGCDGCGGASDICGNCLEGGYAGPADYRFYDRDTLDRSLLAFQLLQLRGLFDTLQTSIADVETKLRQGWVASTADFTTIFSDTKTYQEELATFQGLLESVSTELNAK